MIEEKPTQTENKKNSARSRRSVATYLVILFVVALLLLVLAYFMQERTFAQSAAQLMSMM